MYKKVVFTNNTTIDFNNNTLTYSKGTKILTRSKKTVIEYLLLNYGRYCTKEEISNSTIQIDNDNDADDDIFVSATTVPNVVSFFYKHEVPIKNIRGLGWSIPKEEIKEIEEAIRENRIERYTLHENNSADSIFCFDSKDSILRQIDESVFGREKELQAMASLLQNRRIIYITGINGIGKTTLVKQFIANNISTYTNIIYLSHKHSIKEMIVDDNVISLKDFYRKILSDGNEESDEEYFDRKITHMRKYLSRNTLFVLDDLYSDGNMERLLDIGASFIIVTHRKVKNNHTIKIGPLSVENQNKLFSLYYQRKDIDYGDGYFRKLLELSGEHTFSIILLAKQLMISRNSTKELYMSIKDNGLLNTLNENVSLNEFEKSKKAFEYINELFKFANLSNDETRILFLLSCISPATVLVKDLKKWSNINNVFQIVETLSNAGWINIDDESDTITIEPIVREVVLGKINKNSEDLNVFSKEFLKEYTEFEIYAFPKEIKQYYLSIAENILKVIHSISSENIHLFFKAERLMSFLNKIDSVKKIEDKIGEFVKGNNDYNEGYFYYCIGWTQATQKRDYKNGQKNFEKSIKILGNEKGIDVNILLANIYADMGKNTYRLSQIADSKKYLKKAIDIIDSVKTDHKLADLQLRKCWYLTFLSDCYIELNEFDLARNAISNAETIQKEYSGKEDTYLSNILYKKSLLSYKLGDHATALTYARNAYEIYKNYYPEISYRNIHHLKYIGELYEKINDSNNALLYYNNAINIANLLLDDDSELLKELRSKCGIK